MLVFVMNRGVNIFMKTKLNKAQLYGIVDLGYVDKDNLENVCLALIAGGVDILQLRAKGYDQNDVESFARRLRPLCQKASVPFIVNDFPEVAAIVKADGVHVGQDDGSLRSVRGIVGEKMIIGRSTHTKEQANLALLEGFDYIGFGPLFLTPTKKGRPGIGVEDILYVENKVGAEIPVFCIGGIKRGNIKTVIQAGARRVVIVSDLLTDSSVEAATKEVKTIINQTTLI